MSVPRYVLFVEPILRYLALRESSVTASDACDAAARELHLSDADRALELASGGQVYKNRAAWAFNLLKRTRLAEAPTPGQWQLTDEGRSFARANPTLTRVHLSNLVLRAKAPSSSAPPEDLTPGPHAASFVPAELGNRKAYRLPASPLSVGGQAEVFEATRKRDNRVFVLKRTRGPHSGDRMRREIEIQSSLEHPNIMPVMDWDPIDFRWYVMPRGNRVMSQLSRPLEHEVLCRLVTDIVAALEFAHTAGHPHRDLKPQNIIELSDAQGQRWVVADWGLTRRAPGDTTAKLTHTGQFLGTLGYAPPEAHQDPHRAGPPGDVYALGQVIAWAVGGEPVPFVAPDVAEPWRQLVEPMTRLEVKDRIQNMAEVRRLLELVCKSRVQ